MTEISRMTKSRRNNQKKGGLRLEANINQTSANAFQIIFDLFKGRKNKKQIIEMSIAQYAVNLIRNRTMLEKSDYVSFPPNALIEIDDFFGNFRKVVVVDLTGESYVELSEDPQIAWPIHALANPVAIGDTNEWIANLLQTEPESASKFNDLYGELLKLEDSPFVIYRAAHFAYKNKNFDIHTALNEGKNQTNLVIQSRRIIQEIEDSQH